MNLVKRLASYLVVLSLGLLSHGCTPPPEGGDEGGFGGFFSRGDSNEINEAQQRAAANGVLQGGYIEIGRALTLAQTAIQAKAYLNASLDAEVPAAAMEPAEGEEIGRAHV